MKREFNKVWFCVAVLALGLLVANIKQAAASEISDSEFNEVIAFNCGYSYGALTPLIELEKVFTTAGSKAPDPVVSLIKVHKKRIILCEEDDKAKKAAKEATK